MSDEYEFSINKTTCLQAHDAISAAARAIEESLRRIEAEGKILLSSWEGAAREAFLTRQTKWNADADAILQKLRQINAALEQAVYIYENADLRGAQMISGG
jgi:WXG100 family type VII secretion target